MLSRVAENIYWMARYIERAQNVARILDVNNHLLLDASEDGAPQWMPLIAIMADEEPFRKKHGRADARTVTEFMAAERDNANSIYSCLRAARENARTVREAIPSDLWLQLNTLYLAMSDARAAGPDAITPDLLARI
ncbi:alpha-E domain-containing protein, partial [Candidatus Poribacteria bacterium]|nr:alpha-E domain-containing protein [Candidatus Poribacteria bacterium]